MSNIFIPSRRDFIRTSAGAAATVAASSVFSPFAAAGTIGADKIRVGIVGCGGRGSGAAAQALHADSGAILVAMGDTQKSNLDRSYSALKAESVIGERVQVTPDRMFVGLDAYLNVINSGVDLVLLTTPPGFRPQHIKAAVDAGKHIFAEKPMATDAVGLRIAETAAKKGKEKGLAFVSGFCWRYDPARREFYKRLLNGELGEVRGIHATYLTTPVKPMPPASSRPAGMSDTEWQIRNWYNFTWLSGDGLVEQACHSVDKILWAMKDVPPVKCLGTGGRVYPNGEGNIFDHIDVFYEWADGTRASMAQRQLQNTTYSDNSDYLAYAKGHAEIVGFSSKGIKIVGPKGTWKFDGVDKNMYQVEHDEMFASIRAGKPNHDGEHMARSTRAGLMGRMAAYTGEEITWEQMLKSEEKLVPDNLDWNGPLPLPKQAVPGLTKFV